MSKRGDFERWWKAYYGDDGQRSLKRDKDGVYIGLLARWAFIGWSAGQDALQKTVAEDSE